MRRMVSLTKPDSSDQVIGCQGTVLPICFSYASYFVWHVVVFQNQVDTRQYVCLKSTCCSERQRQFMLVESDLFCGDTAFHL